MQQLSFTRSRCTLALAVSIAVLSACDPSERPIEPELHGPSSTAGVNAVSRTRLASSSDGMFAQLAQEVPGFGGFFFREGHLVLVLVDPGQGPAAHQAVRRALEGAYITTGEGPADLDRYSVQAGSYEFLQLLDWKRQIAPLASRISLTGLGVDESNNVVSVSVARAAEAVPASDAIASLGVPENAYRIKIRPPASFLKALSDRFRRTEGGIQVSRRVSSTSYRRCTLGFNAIANNGDTVFVTNSHCTPTFGVVDGTTFHQPKPNDPIGVEVQDVPTFACDSGPQCRYSDAALVSYSNPGSDWQLGVIARPVYGDTIIDSANPRFFITGELSQPPYNGQRLEKVGIQTGWTGGDVTGTCEDIENSAGIWLLCQDLVAASRANGDSGAPVFQRNGSGSDVTLYGLLWGAYGSDFVFSSLQEIEIEDFYGDLITF